MLDKQQLQHLLDVANNDASALSTAKQLMWIVSNAEHQISAYQQIVNACYSTVVQINPDIAQSLKSAIDTINNPPAYEE